MAIERAAVLGRDKTLPLSIGPSPIAEDGLGGGPGDPATDQQAAETFRWTSLIWSLVPVCIAAPLLAGQTVAGPSVLGCAGVSAALAVAATLIRAASRNQQLIRLCTAVTLTSLASVFLSGLWPSAWATGGLAAYAAVLAVLTLYRDWRVLAVAAPVSVVQLAALVVLMPASPSAVATLAGSGPAVAVLSVAAAALISLARTLDASQAALHAQIAAEREAARARERSLRMMSETASDLAGQATTDLLARRFEDNIGQLVDAASRAAQNVSGAVRQISDVAGQTAERTEAIASASEDTSKSAKDVADSVEQLAASVARVTREVREVSEASFRAMEDAGATNVTVQRLSDTTAEIGKSVGAIRRIADQTRMVALNATIEAARAGEAGKGFHVVADEVKALARLIALATDNIQAHIGAISTDMAHATSAIDTIAATVAHLGGITVSVAGSMDEQASVAKAIADSASRAAASTETVVGNLQMLVEGSGKANAAALDGQRDAADLAQQCDRLEAAVKTFIANLLAA
jgi:methyl-accepting chemotaxis protein